MLKSIIRSTLISLCLILFLLSHAYANSNSKIDNNSYRNKSKNNIAPTPPYIPPSFTRGGVLFVEDPGDPGFGPATKPDTNWQAVLNQILGQGNYGWFGPTTTPTQNGPDSTTMQNYDLIIWNCYDFWWSDMALTSTDQTNLQRYISGGGKVWLLGQDIIYSGVPLSWLSSNFHLASAIEDYCSDETVLDLLGLAEINGLTFTANCDYQSNGYWCDALTPDAQAHHIIQDLTYTQYNSIAYPNTTPLQTSFWTVDGRNPTPWNQWVAMVSGMLQAFGVYGVQEKPEKTPSRKIGLSISPSILLDKVNITYNIPVSGKTKIGVYDLTGKLVKNLINTYKNPGTYKLTWDGKDEDGSRLAGGLYIVMINCSDYSCSRILTVLK